jgi:hypothetical protein
MILTYLSLWFNDYFDGFFALGDHMKTSSGLRQGQPMGDHLMHGDAAGTNEVYGCADVQRTGTIGGHEDDPVSPKLIDWDR